MRSSGRTVLALIATMVVIVSLAGVFGLVHSSRNPPRTATIYGVYIAAVALAVSLLMALGSWWLKGRARGATGMSTPEQVRAAADWLADVLASRWRLEAAARRIVTPAPATVRWRWAADDITALRIDVTISPAPGAGPAPLPDLGRPGELLAAGTVTRIHDEVYARLPHGRLVLTGGPGAGKTGAMILLLLAALDRRADIAVDDRDRVPVPVWLTLGGWNPAAMSLRDWAAGAMKRDYPALRAQDYGPDAVGGLLRDGRVALFLDGLDEMPEGVRPLALNRVDEEARGLRVVVTSRSEEYRCAVRAGRLDNTAVIELRPVRPDAAATYLLRGRHGLDRQRWEKVGSYIKDNPDSVAARALANPLTLSLARDAYTSQDPAALTEPDRFPTAEVITEHLIDRFLITAYPDERQREHAISWLGWIAHHMGSSQDLPWWDIPRWIPRWKIRLTRGLATGLTVGLTVGLAVGTSVGALWHIPAAFAAYIGFMIGLTAGLVAGLIVRLEADHPRKPVPIRNRGLPAGLAIALAFGLFVGVCNMPSAGLAGGLAGGLLLALAVGLPAVLAVSAASGLARLRTELARLGFGLSGAPQTLVPRWPRPRELARIIVAGLVFLPVLVPMFLNLWATPIADAPSSTAASAYRADRRTCMIYGLVYAAPLGLLMALAIGLTHRHAHTLASALGTGLLVAVAIWVTAWFAGGQVPLVKLTELILIPERGRVHLLQLLEDALSRQVLRQAGALYQFRHAALQARLAALHSQPPSL
jgi:hypothetical protein